MIRDLAAFKVWLTVCGAEVLSPINEWEVLRVKTRSGIMVVQRNKRGRQIWPLYMSTLAEYFAAGHFPDLFVAHRYKRGKMRELYPVLVHRDGDECFYCGFRVPHPKERTDPLLSPTVEHLVSKSHGGTDHPSNLFLSHFACNQRAGNLSAPEKIKLRDEMRAAA